MWGKGQAECLGRGWNSPPVSKALTRPGHTENPIGYMKNGGKGEIAGGKRQTRGMNKRNE